jgi:hypothetical protein
MQSDAHDIDGAIVYDRQGDNIGKVDDLFIDEQTMEPEWLHVDAGVSGGRYLIPTRGMSPVDDGLQVPFSKDAVKHSPDISPDGDSLTEEDEHRLYDHYGLAYGTERSETGLPDPGVRPPAERVRLKKRIVTEDVTDEHVEPVERQAEDEGRAA